jgi:hypothetical protein
MTAEATLGRVKIRFSGGVTPAYDRASLNLGDSVFSASVVAVRQPSASMDPFEAIRHDQRVTNYPSVVCEGDSLFASYVAPTTGERFHAHNGRLLVFKNQR